MNHLIGQTGREVARPTNRTPAKRYDREVTSNRRTSIEKAFPINPATHLYGVERPVGRATEVIYVEKKVLDSDLKQMLWVLVSVLGVAFVVGLILWAMS